MWFDKTLKIYEILIQYQRKKGNGREKLHRSIFLHIFPTGILDWRNKKEYFVNNSILVVLQLSVCYVMGDDKPPVRKSKRLLVQGQLDVFLSGRR